MLRPLFLVVLLALCLTRGARGEPPSIPTPLSLSDAVALAVAADPAGAALERRTRDLALAARLAGAPPPLTLTVAASVGAADESANSLVQSFQLGPGPGLAARAARAELQAAQALLQARRVEVARTVAQAYTRAAAAALAQENARTELETRATLLDLTDRRFEAGDIALSSVVRFRRERARAERALAAVTREREAALAGLAVLIGAPPGTPLELSETPAPTPPEEEPEAMVSRALAARWELRARRAEREARASEVGVARSQGWPLLSLSAYQSRLYGPDQESGVAATINVPLADWGTRRAEVARAEAAVKAVEAELGALERDTAVQVVEARARWLRLREQRQSLIEGEFAEAQRLLDMLERGYRAGLVSQLEVLEAALTLRELRAEAVRLEAEERAAAWDLTHELGGPFPGLDVPQDGGSR